jgi:hypothetical protein
MEYIHRALLGKVHQRPICVRAPINVVYASTLPRVLGLIRCIPHRLCCSAKVYPIEALMADCRQYFAVSGRRVTFEYTLMAGVNDGRHHVRSPSLRD